MATAISPHLLLREVVTEFARLSDTTLLTFPEGDPDPVRIKDEDLQSLQPKRHLSISIIDFYIKYLEKEVLSFMDKDRFFFFNCSFFISTFGTKIQSTEIDYEQARQWIRGVNLFEKDYIFIPVHKSEHWSLIIIYHLNSLTVSPTDVYYRSPGIFHLDSVEGKHDDLGGDIRSFIFKSWTEIHQNSDILQALFRMKYVEAKVPQEDNGYDSGIYLLHYMELFILESASPNFSFGKEQGKLHFLGWDTSEFLAKRKHIQNLILKLSGMTQLQGTLRLYSSDIFSWLRFKAASEERFEDVQNRDLTMVNGKDAESEHGGHQTGAVTVLDDVYESTTLLGENRRSREFNWSATETSVLLRCIVHFDRLLQGNATRWDFIVGEVNKLCGTTHDRMQCQYRFDTLSKAFKKVNEFCRTNGKEFSEITEMERREMKLATTLTREWYTLMAQHYICRDNYRKFGMRPSESLASFLSIEAPADRLSSPRLDTPTLLLSNAGELRSETLPWPPVAILNNCHDGNSVPESLLTSYPRPLVQRRKRRSNESRSDEGPMKGVYMRSVKDSHGRLLRVRFEPRFKPPRDPNSLGEPFNRSRPLYLGSYKTRQEARDMRQIAAFFYGKGDALLDLGHGTYFCIRDRVPVDCHGKEKRDWVCSKAKEIFADFQMAKVRLSLSREEEPLSPRDPERQMEPPYALMDLASDCIEIEDDDPRLCLEGGLLQVEKAGLNLTREEDRLSPVNPNPETQKESVHDLVN